MKKVLFVTYGGGHVNMIIPLLKKLQDDPNIECATVGLTTAGAVLRHHGFKNFGFASIMDYERDKEAYIQGQNLASTLDHNDLVPLEESIAYLGLSYCDLKDRLGAEKAQEAFDTYGRASFLPIGPMNRLFDIINPDLVVTTISPRAEQAALIVARQRNIPSIRLIDLDLSEDYLIKIALNYGDRLCVLCEDDKRKLIAQGKNDKDVIVTGNPSFDNLSCPDLQSLGFKMRQERDWEGKKVILFALHTEEQPSFLGKKGNQQEIDLIEPKLIEIVERHPTWHLIIRPHPSQSYTRKTEKKFCEISNYFEDLHTLISAVDLVITVVSTVGLEACFANKPLVSLESFSVFPPPNYNKLGFSCHKVDSLDQLEEAIKKGLLQKTSKRAVGFPPLGISTESVINQIKTSLEIFQ